jgi:hypothetical protein
MKKFEHEKWLRFIFVVLTMKTGNTPISGLLQETVLIFPKFLSDRLLGK